jgi:lactate permease
MEPQVWAQVYDPVGSMLWSTLLAAIPIVILLGAIGIFEIKAHIAALLGLATSLWSPSSSSACPRAWPA